MLTFFRFVSGAVMSSGKPVVGQRLNRSQAEPRDGVSGEMTAQELRNLRAFPRLFDLEGTPVRIVSRTHLPEIYVGAGQWSIFPARSRLLIHGRYITLNRFEALCDEYDRFLDHGGPFLEAAS